MFKCFDIESLLAKPYHCFSLERIVPHSLPLLPGPVSLSTYNCFDKVHVSMHTSICVLL